MKKAIIVGATGGIGREVAKLLIEKGWSIGICGRRTDLLEQLKTCNPEKVYVKTLDITQEDAPKRLLELIELMKGIDLYLHVSGIGYQNKELDINKELRTVETNTKGFTRMMCAVFNYFVNHPERQGHIACISSIAGTKGLGAAPSYSATKRYCNTYMEALEQLATLKNLSLTFTDIRPGFVDTDLLKGDYQHPLMMQPDKVAKSILVGIEHKKRIITIDWRYKIIVFFWRLIPKGLWVKLRIQ